MAVALPCRADEAPKARAREAFERGAVLVKDAKWSEALAAFDASFALAPHPVTLFNVGACERALGTYTRARRTLLRARALDASGEQGHLPESARSDIDAFLTEIASVLVTVDVKLDPPTATIAVDGRPLEVTAPDTTTAGLAPPGPGQPPPAASFRLEMDPGAHVLVLARPGFQDIVVRDTFARGHEPLSLVLSRLDGTLELVADRERAAVSVDGLDVGLVPVTLRRPAGRYHIVVRRPGYVPFATDATLEAGGRVAIAATLPPEREPITKTWWFWAAAGGVLATATATTYFLTRPEPSVPPANGGGLGWVVRAP